MSVLLAIIVFGILIFIHELGHFLVARAFGVTVLEFAIGMGPKILSHKSKKTGIVYSLRLFPIGGYVNMLGENGMNLVQGSAEQRSEAGLSKDSFFIQSEKKEPEDSVSDPRAYCNQPAWKRLLISFAGPLMNLFLGFLLMFAIVIAAGHNSAATPQIAGFYVQYTGEEEYCGLQKGDYLFSLDTTEDENRILSKNELTSFVEENGSGIYHLFILRESAEDYIEADVFLDAEILEERFTASLSEQSGLLRGDIVKKVNSTPIHIYDELAYEVMNQGYEPMTLTVLRGEETVVLENIRVPSYEEKGTVFGNPDFIVYREKDFGVKTVFKHSFYRSVSTVKMVIDSIAGLFSKRYGMEAVSGPIGITKELSSAAKMGATTLLYFVSVISINLGIMNMLPLPAMDGGHNLLYIIEMIRRKPIKRELEGAINFIGLVLILALAVIIAVKDVISL